MTNIDPLFLKLDQLICTTRLQSVAMLLQLDRSQRIGAMLRSLSQLKPGAYLLGVGPSTAGIYPLTVEEVVLGRPVTPLETPPDAVIDFYAADTAFFHPQEVSRLHAKVVRRPSSAGTEFAAVDLGSRGGTFVNGDRVDDEFGRVLAHGDVISLGASQISSYVFYEVAGE